MSALVAIMAAGQSRRMGQPKLCLPWKGSSVLGHLLAQWREAGAEKIVVIHAGTGSPVAVELERLGVSPEMGAATLAPEREMMGSVVTAARRALEVFGGHRPPLQTAPPPGHLIIALGDQPHLRVETLRNLLLACEIAPGKIVRVVHRGAAGHPIAVPSSLLEELGATSCATLRDFLGLIKSPILDLTCDDSGVLMDIDTPDDYARAVRAGD
jgi:molybdenum cofactor cytidylyltransferase